MNVIQQVRKQMLGYFLYTAFWAIPIFVIVYYGAYLFLDNTQQVPLHAALQTTTIYNLILGLLTMGSAVQAYVLRGVARRDYFIGITQALFIFNATLTVFFTIWHLTHEAVTQATMLHLNGEALTLMITFFLKGCLLYFLGTTISASYYRFLHHYWWVFIIFIVSGHGFVALFDYAWGYPVSMPFSLPEITPSLLLSVGASIALTVISMFLTYRFATNMRVHCPHQ
ncbi:hypothetical protein NSQ26_07050 [Bacillus sp. FSL W7-1360]